MKQPSDWSADLGHKLYRPSARQSLLLVAYHLGLRVQFRCRGGGHIGGTGDGPVRQEVSSGSGRRHLGTRSDPVRIDRQCPHAGAGSHLDRLGRRCGLRHRHRLHRRVCAQSAAGKARHFAAMDDYDWHLCGLRDCHRGLFALAGRRAWERMASYFGARGRPCHHWPALPIPT